jgi:hypothetical protein
LLPRPAGLVRRPSICGFAFVRLDFGVLTKTRKYRVLPRVDLLQQAADAGSIPSNDDERSFVGTHRLEGVGLDVGQALRVALTRPVLHDEDAPGFRTRTPRAPP